MDSSSLAPRSMKTFFTIWLGQLISIVGSGLTSFALGVWIFQQTGQATPFALTVLFGTLPRLLLSPLAGSFADRRNRRAIMILADSGNALVTLVAVLLLFLGDLQVWQIYLIAVGGAVCSAFQEPAYTASIAMLVPKKDLARASGLVQVSQSLEMLVAPLLAGILFVSVGLRGIILIDFVTYFFALFALLVVRIPQPEAPPSQEGARGVVRSDLSFSWRYLRDRPGLFWLLWYYALVNFLLNLAVVLIVPMVLAYADPRMLGLMQTLTGLGMLVGSIVMSTWGGPQRRISGIIGFIMLASVGLSLAGVAPYAPLTAAGMFLLTFSIPLSSGPSQALFQTKIAPQVQGRVFAMRAMISRSIMPLAYLIAGPLADRVFEPWMHVEGVLGRSFFGNLIGAGPGRGVGLIFVLSGLTLFAVSLLAFANPRIRRVESELPDELPDEALQPAQEPASSLPVEPAVTE